MGQEFHAVTRVTIIAETNATNKKATKCIFISNNVDAFKWKSRATRRLKHIEINQFI